MRIGKRRPRPSLSVCCITDQAPQQTAAVLAPLRRVAGEVVIGLDPCRIGERTAYERLADRVLLMAYGPLEHNVAAVHAACRHDWVLRIDADEVASPAFVDALPGLIRRSDVRQYAFRRRWLTPDGAHWINEAPWWPDWQVRLVRRETAVFRPEVHAPVEVDGPRLFAVEPLCHASAVLLTPHERQRRVLEYEVVHRGGPGTLREATVRIYEPERFATRPAVPVPDEDRAAIEAFLAAAPGAGREHQRHASGPQAGAAPAGPLRAGVRAARPAADLGLATGNPDAEEARITVLERDLQFVAGEPRTLAVRLVNRSTERWASGEQVGDRGHVVSYRWLLPDGTQHEGIRSPLPIPLDPGEALVVPVTAVAPHTEAAAELRVQVVHEHVRWLEGDARLLPEIREPEALPVRREIRPGGPDIPRILHRVWLGGAPLPERYAEYGDSWASHHPDWEMRLWTDDDVPPVAGVERARNLAERADLVRYEILRRHGGVYVDTDVECLRPIDELLRGVVAFSAYEVPGRLCNAVMGGVSGHPALARTCELAAVTAGHGHYPEATATTFTTYLLEAHPDVTLFGPDRFYPDLWDGTENHGAEAPYARHHWAKSWTAGADAGQTAREQDAARPLPARR